MKSLKLATRLTVGSFAIIGMVYIGNLFTPQEQREHDHAVDSMGKCWKTKDVNQDPLEWIKCVDYNSGYAPLKEEPLYLDALIDFNSEVRRNIASAACNELPIAPYDRQGFKNPKAYLVWRKPALERQYLKVRKLKEAGIDVNTISTIDWNWAKFLGASKELSDAIRKSGHPASGDKRHALTSYLDFLRLVIYRNNYLEDITAMCPAKTKDFDEPID